MLLKEHGFYRVSIKGIVRNYEQKILMLKEDDGTWDLPWWWRDHSENIITWLTREFEEEIWVKIHTINNNPSYIWKTEKSTHFRLMIAYEVSVHPNQKIDITRSNECVDYWFFSEQEIWKGIINLNKVCVWFWKCLSLGSNFSM